MLIRFTMVELPISAEEKFREAVYFFNRMLETRTNVYELPFNFSAFLSAMRSVTLYLQEQFAKNEGFGDWYATKQQEMRGDILLSMLKDMRNEVLHARPIQLLISAGPELPEEGVQTKHFEMTLDTDRKGNILIRTKFTEDSPGMESQVIADWHFVAYDKANVFEVCDKGLRTIRILLDEWYRMQKQKDV